MKVLKRNMLFMVLMTASMLVYGEEENLPRKVSELRNGNYRFFGGFDFVDMSVNDHSYSLEDMVNKEIDIVVSEDQASGENSNYAIVGHSQGGLRVLAYATMLEERSKNMSDPEKQAAAKANYDRLGAVITMSGIDRGIKAGEYDFTLFRSKLLEDVQIWFRGMHGIERIFIPLSDNEQVIMNDVDSMLVNDTVGILSLINSVTLRNYILEIWRGAPKSEVPEIYDMVPGSDFIEKYVSETTPVLYRRQTGVRTYQTWEQVGWCWWWWVDHTEPVYTTYVAYKDNPKFSTDLPVGYIVGTDSNTVGMLMGEAESGFRQTMSVIANVFEVAQIINHAYCYATLGLGYLSGNYTAYLDCCTARDWFNNVDGELNDLKGSDENDGLVAKESQFYPKQFYNPATGEYEDVHTNVLDLNNGKGYVEVDKNHININCEDIFDRVVFKMMKDAEIIQE